MYNILFFAIIIILLFGHFSGLYLDYLNNKMWSDTVPEKLKGIIDETKYRNSQNYYKANTRFGHVSSAIFLVLILAMLFFGGFAWVDNIARSISGNRIIVSILFFAIIGLGSDLLGLPFSWYDTFRIEEKFGFNKTSRLTFFVDHIKSWLMAALIGAPLLALITWIYYEAGEMFWIYVWAVITMFSVFMNMFYSQLIVPFFNKQKPLEEGELRNEIEKMAANAGFRLSNIYTIDGSKRSTKANAYFAGLGPKKRIVLFDTLINDLSVKEITAVLAHEIGHYKRKHSLSMLTFGIIQTGIMLYIFSLLSNNEMLTKAMGAGQSSFHISVFAFFLIYSPVSRIVSLFMNWLSRKNEYEADSYAAAVNNKDNLISALKKLSVKNLSNLNPHPAFVFVHYSHPPLIKRMNKLEKTQGS
ncbi:MAG: M48 family metallopeptidase [Bacteroidales bacterium]|nr:M48 family metallopeptidase [Bacteroidales bacterium]